MHIERVKSIWHNVWYSFAVQLLVLHIRNHHLLLLCWSFLVLMVTGVAGRMFGLQYLFTDPEYLNSVSPLSFGFIGIAFGIFFMVSNLSAYLMSAFRFPFLAALKRPFTKFILNNFLLPMLCLAIMFIRIFQVQYFWEQKSLIEVLSLLLGFAGGLFFVVFLVTAYLYFTNKDVHSIASKINVELDNLQKSNSIQETKYRRFESSQWRVETYLNEMLKPRLVRAVTHYPEHILRKVYRQNHFNAFLILLIGIVFLILLGTINDNPHGRIPAGASMLMIFSIIVSISSAITFWFRRWRFPVMFMILIFLNQVTKSSNSNFSHKVPGLDYSHLSQYNDISSITTLDSLKASNDLKSIMTVMDAWGKKQTSVESPAVFLCASGGGQRAGWWAVQVMKSIDSLSQGSLLNQSVLMTGASGGLTGLAFYRALSLGKFNPNERATRINAFSNDLLNSLAFSMISNDLFPGFAEFKYNNRWYNKDRGYAFELQFNENTKGLLNHSLLYLRNLERTSTIPMLIVSPTINNDGRRLIITPLDMKFMCQPPGHLSGNKLVDGVEFRKMFQTQQADSINFISALRLNCTYPYILPNVQLPTTPTVELMDAGFRDNTGVSVAVRFIWHLRNWFLNHSNPIVIIRIMAGDTQNLAINPQSKGIIESLFNPLGFARSILKFQYYEQENYIEFLKEIFGPDKVKVITFSYQPQPRNIRASMSFHLTAREKKDVEQAMSLPSNQKALQEYARILKN